MAQSIKLIKVGRQGIAFRKGRIPASFFRHQQPGKRFVVLAGNDRRLMHIRAIDLEAIHRAFLCARKKQPGKASTSNGLLIGDK